MVIKCNFLEYHAPPPFHRAHRLSIDHLDYSQSDEWMAVHSQIFLFKVELHVNLNVECHVKFQYLKWGVALIQNRPRDNLPGCSSLGISPTDGMVTEIAPQSVLSFCIIYLYDGSVCQAFSTFDIRNIHKFKCRLNKKLFLNKLNYPE